MGDGVPRSHTTGRLIEAQLQKTAGSVCIEKVVRASLAVVDGRARRGVGCGGGHVLERHAPRPTVMADEADVSGVRSVVG
jgi:D-tyrosyl-tRNA(Tyr) deacylase